MAVLERTTNNYFKVDFTHSFIHNKMVFAAVVVYGTEEDRQLEKIRYNEFESFDLNSKNLLSELSKDTQKTELHKKFALAVDKIIDMRYCSNYDDKSDDVIFDKDVTLYLLSCGYKYEWLKQPIHIVSVKLVNCGFINNETFSIECLYNKLKSKMSANIANV